MAADFNPDIVLIKNFEATKQKSLFQALKENSFSGRLSFKNSQNTEWVFFLYLGRILYVTGGIHPIRRWRRNMALYFPQITRQLQQELQQININKSTDLLLTWDYYLLYQWVEQKKINLERVTKYIRVLTNEVLFDLTQANTVSFYVIETKKQSFQPLAMIDAQQQINYADKLWQQWKDLSFEDISPDLAPQIVNFQTLQESSSSKTYQFLTQVLDGKHTIRDLAFQKKTSNSTFLRSIFHYLQLGDIELVHVPDIPSPVIIPETIKKQESNSKKIQNSKKPLLACVAISPIMKQLMAKVAAVAGYDFIGEKDYIQAMPLILNSKPNIVFLDIELPETNGYEICTQLRKLEYFKNIPIILLGKNITLIERMKSKMSGASELFQQSMDIKSLLNLVQKYDSLSTTTNESNK